MAPAATSTSQAFKEDEKQQASPIVNSNEKSGNSTVQTHQVHLKDLDDAAALVAGFEGEVTEEQSRRVRRKIDLHILPLMSVL